MNKPPDVFTSLADGGVIPATGVNSLRAMARFRNRIVHLYDETDDAEVVKALQHDRAQEVSAYGGKSVLVTAGADDGLGHSTDVPPQR